MAGSTKPKKGKVIVEKVDSNEAGTDCEEPGDDMLEIKEEILDVYDDSFIESAEGCDISSEVKSEDDTREVGNKDSNYIEKNNIADDESFEIKEEKLDGECLSDGVSEDSDIEFEDDSDNDISKSKKEVKEKEEKCVRIMTESSEESGEADSSEDEAECKTDPDSEDKIGLANVIAKILAISGGNNLILSKAKKDNDPVKPEETGEFELVDADGNVKQEVKIEVVEEENESEKARRKHLEREILVKKLKLKPNVETDKEKERKLRIIATQGVVQLFSAIEKHKAVVRKERSETRSVVSREAMSSRDFQDTFYDILDKEGEKVKKLNPSKKLKQEVKDEPLELPAGQKRPKWSVFADNFYKEPTLQGWDLSSDDEDK